MRLRNDLRVPRQREAKERNEGWAALSPAQKIAELDRRLGAGVGAKRQREKLR